MHVMRRLGLLSCQSAQRTAGAARLGVHGGGSAAEQRSDHHEQRDARSTGLRQFEDGLDVGHLVVGGAVLGRETPGVGAGEGDFAVFIDGHGERGLEVLVSVGDRGLGHGVAAGLQSVELDDAVGTGRDFERVLIAVRQHAVLVFCDTQRELRALDGLTLGVDLRELEAEDLGEGFSAGDGGAIIADELVGHRVVILALDCLGLVIDGGVVGDGDLLAGVLGRVGDLHHESIGAVALVGSQVVFHRVIGAGQHLNAGLNGQVGEVDGQALAWHIFELQGEAGRDRIRNRVRYGMVSVFVREYRKKNITLIRWMVLPGCYWKRSILI